VIAVETHPPTPAAAALDRADRPAHHQDHLDRTSFRCHLGESCRSPCGVDVTSATVGSASVGSHARGSKTTANRAGVRKAAFASSRSRGCSGYGQRVPAQRARAVSSAGDGAAGGVGIALGGDRVGDAVAGMTAPGNVTANSLPWPGTLSSEI
jgi:hypothetical protein